MEELLGHLWNPFGDHEGQTGSNWESYFWTIFLEGSSVFQSKNGILCPLYNHHWKLSNKKEVDPLNSLLYPKSGSGIQTCAVVLPLFLEDEFDHSSWLKWRILFPLFSFSKSTSLISVSMVVKLVWLLFKALRFFLDPFPWSFVIWSSWSA